MRDVKGANGFIVARVDASGNVMMGPDAGPAVGRIGNNGEIYDDDAGVHQVGRVDGEGTIWNMGSTKSSARSMLGDEKPRRPVSSSAKLKSRPMPEC